MRSPHLVAQAGGRWAPFPMSFAKAKRTACVTGVAMFVAAFLCPASLFAGLTDTRVPWTYFWNPPSGHIGFVRILTHKGRTLHDHESSSDPTNGGAAVQPAAVDNSSASPNGADPGPAPTGYIGYYNGGTLYDPDDPQTMMDDYILFRVRVDADPSKAGGFDQYHWNVVVDIDWDRYKEFWVDVNGPFSANSPDELHILYNNGTTQEMPDRAKFPEIIRDRFVARCDEVGNLSHTRVVPCDDGWGDWFIDIQVPMKAFTDLSGNQVIFPDQAIVPYYSTSASNIDPLQKDWLKKMQDGTYDPDNPVKPDDPVVPDGSPFIYFTDTELMVKVYYYWVGDNIYVAVPHQEANLNPNVNETITVTVTNPATGDDEILTLRETTPNGGVFTNQGGATLPTSTVPNDGWIPFADTSKTTVAETWTVTRSGSTYTVTGSVSGTQTNPLTPGTEYTSDNGQVTFTLYEGKKPGNYTVTFQTYAADPLTCSNAAGPDDNGDLQAFGGDRIVTKYTYGGEDYYDYADILDNGAPLVLFTWQDGSHTEDYNLNVVQADSDLLYVTVFHAAANTDPNTQQTVTVTLTGNDTQTMSGTYVLTETGPNTGVFRNTTGLPSVATTTRTSENGVWEDVDAAVVTATYAYGGQNYTDTAALHVLGGGQVYFTNPGGTEDVEEYTNGDYVWLKVPDPNCTTPTVNVTVTSTTTGDSETVTLYETFTGSHLYMNLKTDLQTTAGSAVVTSPSSTFQTDGVQPGDKFVIASGPDEGTYTVQSVDSETQITLTTPLTTTRTSSNPVRFSTKPLTAQTFDGSYTQGDRILEAVNNEQLLASYTDADDGDTDPNNNVKTDTAWYKYTPTYAAISSFTASIEGGEAVIEWQTTTENGTVGFYLLRQDRKTRKYLRVSDDLVMAFLTSPQGGTYSFTDPGVSSGGAYKYKLVEVEANGDTREYGPFTVVLGAEELAGAREASSATRPSWTRKPHAVAAAKKARMQATKAARDSAKLLKKQRPKGDVAKITVAGKGLYYLSVADIASAIDMPPEAVKTFIRQKNLRMSHEGKDVAYLQASDYSGIYFYVEGMDSPFSDENVYWLYKSKGIAMANAGGQAPPPAGDQTFVETLRCEKNQYPMTGLFTNPEADYWMWDYIIANAKGTNGKSFTFTVDSPASVADNATLTLRLHGATGTTANPEHHATVTLNGMRIGEARWDGTTAYAMNMTFSQSLLVNGSNTLTVQGILDKGVPYSVFYVNSFDVQYKRRYEAVGDALLCRGDGNSVISITGFTDATISVFDVTDPAKPQQVTAATIDAFNGKNRVSFKAASPEASYFACTAAAANAPQSVVTDMPSDLRSENNRADYVIIAPAELKDAVQALATYRQGYGLAAMVVDLEDVYDEFNYGIASPEAIRSFLTYACGNWKTAPRFVLLAGEGTYDYKNVMGFGESNLVPPIMVGTRDGLFASDNRFADIVGDDGIPEIAIGRLPAATAQELQGMIEKIIAQESAAGSWRNHIVMLADNPDSGGNFSADSDDLARLIPAGYATDKVYLGEYDLATARQLALDGINNGAILTNFIGHGALDRLAQEGLLVTADMASLNNGERAPVVTAFTCVSGRFDLPGYDCFAEAMLAKAGGGAVAVWGPSGVSYNREAKFLGESFLNAAFGSGKPVLGEAVLAAVRDYAARGRMLDTMKTYNLLGDPAQRLFGDRASGSAGKVADRPKKDKQAAESAEAVPDTPDTLEVQVEAADKGKDKDADAQNKQDASKGKDTSVTVAGGIVVNPAEGAAGAETGVAGVRVVANEANRIALEITPPSPNRIPVGESGEKLEIAEFGSTDQPGDPMLPVRGFAIQVPEGMAAAATVVKTEAEDIKDITIVPAPRWVLRESSSGKTRVAEGADWSLVAEPVAPSAVYSSDANWPAEIVKVEAGGKMGDRNLALVTITPVTYNPVTKQAKFYKRIEVELTLTSTGPSAGNAAGLAAPAWTPGGDAVKIGVSTSGIHRVSVSDLQKAGFKSSGDPGRLRLFYRGIEAPTFVPASGDCIDFLGAKPADTWCKEAVYWLVAGSKQNLRMGEIDATPQKKAPVAKVAPVTVVLDAVGQVLFADENLPLENRWLLAEVAPGAKAEFKLAICAPDKSVGATLKIEGDNASRVGVSVNGSSVGEGLSLSLDKGRLVHGENSVVVQNNGQLPLLLRRIAMVYTPDINAVKPGMRFSVAGNGVLKLSGATDAITDIYDVTTAPATHLAGVQTVREGNKLVAQFAVAAGHVYEIADPTAAGHEICSNKVSDLYAGKHAADYVIITHSLFESDAKRLALHRASQGRRVEVVDIEDVFDEFAFGEADPSAIRRFIAHAYKNWSPGVRQVVLFGDGAIGQQSSDNFIPPHIEVVGEMATASDSWYGCVDGADNLPDVEIGRLPVRDQKEAQAVVSKLIAYDFTSPEQSWAHRMFHVGGDIGEGSKEVSFGMVTTPSEMLRVLGDGSLFLTVLGPGGIARTFDGLLNGNDAQKAAPRGDGLPLLISVEAMHGYYQSPTLRSLAEGLLCDRGGVVGAIVNTGVMNADDARLMTGAIVHEALASADSKQGAGSLLDAGRLSLVGQISFASGLRTCLLLGDPATVVKAPPVVEEKPQQAAGKNTREGSAPAASSTEGEDSQYALIWQVLSPGSGSSSQQEAGAGAAVNLILKATMVEEAVPCAIVQRADGRQQLVKIGDRVDGAEVLAINSGSIVVRIGGRTLEITLRRK